MAAATRDYNAIMAELELEDPEAHARITRAVDELRRSLDSEADGAGPLPIICGWRGCDEVLVGHDAWSAHHRESHHAEEE